MDTHQKHPEFRKQPSGYIRTLYIQSLHKVVALGVPSKDPSQSPRKRDSRAPFGDSGVLVWRGSLGGGEFGTLEADPTWMIS